MLKTRIITAIIGIPLIILLFEYSPEWVLIPIFTILTAISVTEMALILIPKLNEIFAIKNPGHRVVIWWTTFCCFVACSLFLIGTMVPPEIRHSLLVVEFLAVILVGAFIGTAGDNPINGSVCRIAGFLITICYAGLPWLAIWYLYTLGNGSRYVFLLLTIIWCNDTAAYFGGTLFGKRKLAEVISPKKTWEGAITGLVFGIAGGFLLNLFYRFNLGSIVLILIASIVCSIMGQIGDLVESTFKRFGGVKDSGFLVPGHGGLLDRVDGVLFAAPILWVILFYFR